MLIRLQAALVLLLAATAVHALTVVIGNGSAQVAVRIGSAGATIDTVSFNVAAASVGNSAAVTGAPAIDFTITARAPLAGSRTAQLTVNSATPLINGAATLPFTSISWTASDATIPAATFSGTAAQLLVQFTNSQRLTDTHTFLYANTQVLEAGTYSGRVTYTLSMP